MPDPERLGGLAWTRRTKGALTPAERRKLYVAVARGQAQNAVGRLKLVLGRAPRAADHVPEPPDSAFARDAQEACDDQPRDLRLHSYRTWAFGHALAALDGERLDPEAFWCAALLHDAGLVHPVPGEDFTLRSAAQAMSCADRHGIDGDLIGDAITVHATAGITPDRDGAAGVYLAAGALLDLGGLRLWDASERLIDDVAARWPRPDLLPYIAREADAVPRGRFALLRSCGITIAIRASPLRR